MTKINNRISKKIIAAIVATLLVLTMVPNSLFNSISALAAEGDMDSTTGLQGFNDEEFQEWFNDFSEDYIETPSSDEEYYNYGSIDEYLNAEVGEKVAEVNKNDEPLSYDEIVEKIEATHKQELDNVKGKLDEITGLLFIWCGYIMNHSRDNRETFLNFIPSMGDLPKVDPSDAIVEQCNAFIETYTTQIDELNNNIKSGYYSSDILFNQVQDIINSFNDISATNNNYLKFWDALGKFSQSAEVDAAEARFELEKEFEKIIYIEESAIKNLKDINKDIEISYSSGKLKDNEKEELKKKLSDSINNYSLETQNLIQEAEIDTSTAISRAVKEANIVIQSGVNEALSMKGITEIPEGVGLALPAWNFAKQLVDGLQANYEKLKKLEIEIADLEPLVALATQDLTKLSDSIDALQLYVKNKQAEIDKKIDQLTLNLENQNERTATLESTLHSLMIVVETMYTNTAFSISAEKFYEVKSQVLNFLNQLASECTNDKQDVLNTKDEISALLDDVWFTNIWLYGQNEELYVACNDKYETIMQALDQAKAIQVDTETFFTGSASNSLTASNGMLNIVERSVREIEAAAADVNKIKDKIADVSVDADIVLDPDNVLNKFENLLGFTNKAIENVTAMEFHALPDNGGGTNPGGQGGGIRNANGSGLAQTGDSMLALCVLCGLALIASAGVFARQRKNKA